MVSAGFLVEKLHRARGALERGADARVLRIEEPQRVLRQLAAVVFAETGGPRNDVRPQRLAERNAGRGRTDRVQRHRQRPEAERAKELEEHFEDLRLRGGTGNPEELDADLRELAKAPRLRSLVSKLGPDVVEAQRHRPGGEPVLDHGADDASRVLR